MSVPFTNSDTAANSMPDMTCKHELDTEKQRKDLTDILTES